MRLVGDLCFVGVRATEEGWVYSWCLGERLFAVFRSRARDIGF